MHDCPTCNYFGICPSHRWIYVWHEEQKKRDLEELKDMYSSSQVKYVIHPGWVYSRNDRDRHYVDFMTLCRLYHVDPRYCINAADPHSIRGMNLEDYEIHLYPDPTGAYTVDCESAQ